MILTIPNNKDEFLMLAMRNYDKTCISMKEFKKDLRLLNKIRKDICALVGNSDYSKIRPLLNNILIVFNQFGEVSTSLIFYTIQTSTDDQLREKALSIACLFIIKLGRRDNLVDNHQLSIDETILDKLQEI